MPPAKSFLAATLVLGLILAGAGGCATQGQTGALTGAGVGALIGQAVGRNTAATLIGAGVGLGLGYIIGNEMDKADSRQRHSVRHEETAALANTAWKVVSIVPMDQSRPFTSWKVHFRPDGTLLSSKVRPEGRVEEQVERYRIVGSTLIINQDDYVINGRFRIEGHRMYLDTGDYSFVMERI